MDHKCAQEDEEKQEEMDEDLNSQILQQMAKYSQLKDLLHAHHITGTNKILSYCVITHLSKHEILTSVFHADVIRWLQPCEDLPRQRGLYFSGNCLQWHLLRNIQPGVKSEASNEDHPS